MGVQISKEKENSIFSLGQVGKMLTQVAFLGILLIMAVLVFFLVSSSLSGGTPAVFGHRLYIVLSGSMAPTFDAGSMVVVQPTSPSELQVGDIITFTGPEDGEKLITHRIVGLTAGEELAFITKGDNNQSDDPEPVGADQVVGRVRFALPYAGRVADFAQTKGGLLALVIIPGALIIAFELRNIFRCAAQLEKKKEEEKALAALAEEGEN